MNTLANSEKIQIINDTFINLIEKINKVYKYHETLSKIDSYLDKLKTELVNIPTNKNFQNFLTFLVGVWEDESGVL